MICDLADRIGDVLHVVEAQRRIDVRVGDRAIGIEVFGERAEAGMIIDGSRVMRADEGESLVADRDLFLKIGPR